MSPYPTRKSSRFVLAVVCLAGWVIPILILFHQKGS